MLILVSLINYGVGLIDDVVNLIIIVT